MSTPRNNNTTSGNEKNLRTLENVNFEDKTDIVNSPRSIEAAQSLGIDLNSLYLLSKKEYISSNPEIKKLTEDLQDVRYDHYKKKREEKIQRLYRLRK